MKKGDKQFDVGYGQGGGGGMAGAYRGSTVGGGGTIPRPPPLPRKGADIDEIVFHNMRNNEAARAIEKSVRNPQASSRRIDRPMAAVGVGAAGAAAAGVAAKKREDTERLEAYKRKPRMADKAPKVNLRKAYQD